MIILIKRDAKNFTYFFVLLLYLSSQSLFAQNKTITGLVTDEENVPLPGVTVLVKGTLNGASTSFDGKYELTNLSEDAVLVFSYVGMVTQEIAIQDKEVINVILLYDLNSLKEVVVVGYGTQKAGDITGAVALVDDSDLKYRPNTDVSTLVTGKAAGIVAAPSSGKPGQGISLNIRGLSSLQGNDPLYVVDGVPTRSTRDLNPADIESISVLKDASSAAIYGSQGANGVVIITTKSGKSQTPRIAFNNYLGITQVQKKLDLLNATQYQDLMTELGYNTNWAELPFNNDWQDQIFQNGITQNYQLSFSGRSNQTKYYVSGGWTKDAGIIRNVEAGRTNVKLNLDQEITDWMSMGARVTYNNYSDVDVNDSNRDGVITTALITPPNIGIFNPNGSFTSNPFQNWENPLAITDGLDRDYKSNGFLGNAFVEFKFLKGFKFKSNFGVEQTNGEYTEFRDPFRTTFGQVIGGRAVSATDAYSYRIIDNLLSYKKTFSDVHKFEAMVGYINQSFKFESQGLTTRNFAGDDVTTAGAGSEIENFFVSKSERKNVSYISRINYAYDDKYLLTTNFRRDGSSIFGPGERYGLFASTSLGWRISKEKFAENIDWLNDLKLRVSFGTVGNDPAEPYAYLGRTRAGTNYAFGDTVSTGIYPINIENRNLKWEQTEEINIGLDFAIFNNRISSSIDFYNRQANDVIQQNIPIPSATGFSSAVGNAMSIRNTGLEFLLNTVNIDNEKFKWTSNLNFSINRNEVTDTKAEEVFDGFIENRDAATITRVGDPVSLLYGYEFVGVDPTNGRAQYLTANNEITYTPDADRDRRIIGNPHPDIIYGFTNTFSYKGFSLSIFLQGSQGNDMLNATRFITESMNDPSNQSAAVLRRWRQPGDITDVPGVSAIGDVSNSIVSTRFVEDASYLRVKTLSLNYNIPEKILSKLKVKNLTLYATGENLFTFTNYTGLDPEVNAGGGSATSRGIDFGTYPQPRRLIFGLNITL